jgi:hypothetical protein
MPLNDLMPCRTCLKFPICNSEVCGITEMADSYLNSINFLQNKCDDFRKYVDLNHLTTMFRHMRFQFGGRHG